MGPDGKIIMENSKERQLDSVFTAKSTGEYSFCFNNEMSTFAEKMVDFEIAVRTPFSKPLPISSEPRHLPSMRICAANYPVTQC